MNNKPLGASENINSDIYRHLAEIATDAGSSILVNNDGTFEKEWVIDRLLPNYGYSLSELDSFDKWMHIIYPDDRKKFLEAKNLLLNIKPVDIDIRIITSHGDIRWIHDSIRPSIDNQSHRIRLVSALKDITKQKQTEHSLRESDARFVAIFNTISIGIVQSNGTAGFDIVNDAFVKMIGYSREELKDIKFYDITPSDDLRKEFEAFNQAVKDKAMAYAITKRYIRKDNSIIICKIDHHLLYDEYKNVTQILSVVQDITEQQQAELALRESEEKYKSLAENTEDIIARIDKNMVIKYINKAVEKYFPVTPESVIGKDIANVDIPENIKNALFDLADAVSNNKQPSGTFMDIFLNDEIKHLHCKFYPEFDANNNVYSYLNVTSDITEIKRIEKELIESKEKAIESDRLKSIFLANMSHEIRTPMNSIVGFSDLLLNPILTSEQRNKYINIIKSSSEQLLTIISDILDISKIEAGQVEINNSNFDLHYLLSDLKEEFDILKQQKDKSHIEIKLPIETNKTFMIYADEKRLKQILSNLLNNALKFTPQGHIEFSYSVVKSNQNSQLIFYVRDTGIGISDDKKAVIFERFRQEEENLNAQYGGSGLGLSICKGLLDIMHGTIWVESSKNIGTTFFISIPCLESNSIAPTVNNHSKSYDKFDLTNKSIIIIDDTAEIHEYLSEVLTEKGATLYHGMNAREGIALLKQHPETHLILMDIRLPDISGIELAGMLKSIQNTPIIAQTAFALSGDKEKILEAGCDDYITKPINAFTLLQKIANYI